MLISDGIKKIFEITMTMAMIIIPSMLRLYRENHRDHNGNDHRAIGFVLTHPDATMIS